MYICICVQRDSYIMCVFLCVYIYLYILFWYTNNLFFENTNFVISAGRPRGLRVSEPNRVGRGSKTQHLPMFPTSSPLGFAGALDLTARACPSVATTVEMVAWAYGGPTMAPQLFERMSFPGPENLYGHAAVYL